MHADARCSYFPVAGNSYLPNSRLLASRLTLRAHDSSSNPQTANTPQQHHAMHHLLLLLMMMMMMMMMKPTCCCC
jgi:hypothetical protein